LAEHFHWKIVAHPNVDSHTRCRQLVPTGVRTATVRGELARLAFREAVFGRRRLYLAGEIAGQADAINGHLTAAPCAGEQAAGNRRSAFALTIADLPLMFARRYRRGGLMRFVVSELYAGLVPRPLHELMVTAAARQRGLPVVEAMGAMVETAGPCLYRGWFLTRALDGVTLWNLLLSGERDRAEAIAQARASVDRLHDGGLYHADLNFHNLFVCGDERPPRVVALDLDKARLYPDALAPALRRANFRRLARSARRLAEAGAVLSAGERTALGLH
jgi:3-deoxy-D-manno-octulosonic acid kinase